MTQIPTRSGCALGLMVFVGIVSLPWMMMESRSNRVAPIPSVAPVFIVPSPSGGGASIQPEPAMAPDGTVVILNKAEAMASIVARKSGKEVARVATGVAPHEVAVSHDGVWAVVANYGVAMDGSTLTVIDLHVSPAAVARTIDLKLGEVTYHRPHGIAFFPDDQRVAVTCEREKVLLVVAVHGGTVLHAIDTGQDGSHMTVLSPSADRAYVANIASGSVSVMDLVKGERMKVIETGRGSEGIDVSPDGREVWVGNREMDTVSVIDTEKLEVVATVATGRFPIRVKFTPDGSRVLVSNANSGDVSVIDAKERKEIKRIAMPGAGVGGGGGALGPIGIVIPTDGLQAFVAHTNADAVLVIDLGKLEVTGTLECGDEPDGLGYSARDAGGG